MGYLTAIIDHYENLPDIMLFMHGHRVAWHTTLGQDWTMRRLATHPPRDLNAVGGYMPLGCQERWHIEKSQVRRLARQLPSTYLHRFRAPLVSTLPVEVAAPV
jgi:hypothetical protein